MEEHIIMDDRTKRNMGILSMIPLAAWGFVFIYYLFMLSPIMRAKRIEAHEAVVTLTYYNYDMLFMMGAIAAVVSAIVLIYFIIHLARIKTMNGATKLMWLMLMSVMAPLGVLLFWYFEIRNERKNMPIHHNIA